jgi:HKD family nuclease
MDDLIKNFTNSLQTGYIDKSILSNIDYQPELLVNQKSPPKKVLSTILQEFENCNQFFISVAFVTTSGVAVIINKLKEKFPTSDYDYSKVEWDGRRSSDQRL